MDLFKLFGTIVVDASEANATIEDTTQNAKQLGTTFANTGNTVQNNSQKWFGKDGKFGAVSVWMGNTLSKLTDMGVNFAKNFFKDGMSYNASMQSYTKAFATYMGNDMKLADEFMGKLKEMAELTPLNLDNLAEGAKRLLGVGVSAEDTLKILSQWGDVSLGDSNAFSRMVLAHSQIISNNRFAAEEMNQLADAGFPIWKLMPEYLATLNEGGRRVPYDQLTADFRKAARNGTISPDTMLGLLDYVTAEETGTYYGGMAKQMEGYNGQLEMLGDTYAKVQGAFTQPFFDEAAASIFPQLGGILDRFLAFLEANPEKFSKFAENVGNLIVGAVSAITDLMTLLIDNQAVLPAVAAGITLIVAAINPAKGLLLAISVASVAIIANWEKLRTAAIEIWGDITEAIDKAVVAVERFFGINRGTGTHETESGNRKSGTGGSFLEEGETPGPLPEDYQTTNTSLWDDVNGVVPVTNQQNKNSFWDELYRPGSYDLGSAMLNLGSDVSEASRLLDINNLQNTILNKMLAKLDTIAANTGAGNNVVLDSGALVGQLMPKIDSGLGSIVARKRGR